MEGNFIIRQVHLVVLLSVLGGVHSQCTGNQCSFDALTLPDNIDSSPQQTCYNVNETVNFNCTQGGLELDGPQYNECQDGGRWKFCRTPFCEDEVTSPCTDDQCSFDALTLPNNIDSSPEEICYNVSERVNFTCQGGLELGGPPYNECQEGGEWRFCSSPFCEDVQACIPHSIGNGYSSAGPNADSSDGYTPFEIIEYSCNDGYILQGPESATCDLGGQWNPSAAPECFVTCGEAPMGTNGAYTSSPANFTVNAVVYFVCYSGFSTTDAKFLECQADGTWSADGPYCADIDECVDGSADCPPDNEICANTIGGYQCECAPGYSRDADGGCSDDVSLECGPNSFRVTMNLARLGEGVEASNIAFMGDQSCRATEFNDTVLVIESELNACGTSVSVTNDYVEYLNIVIDADDADISAPDKILIPVTCSYSKSKTVNPRSFFNDFKVVKTVSRIQAAKFDFLVYEDYQFLLPLLDEGSLLDFTSPIFLEVRAEYSGDVRAGVEQCWATDEGGNKRVQLITDGCPADDSLVTFVETDNPANFRFTVNSGLSMLMDGITEGRIHCDAVACDVNNDDSICSSSCGSSKRRKRSLNGFLHASRISVG